MIRDATPADIEAVTSIYRRAVLHGTGTFEIDPPDRTEMEARHARIVGAGYPYLVAEVDGAVVGYAYAAAFRDRGAFRYLVEDSVYVRADAQGRGVGRALLNRLIARATTAGFRQMVALIGDSDNAGSIALHARAGFLPAGVMPTAGWKFGRWIDVVLMRRALGPGDATMP